MYALAPAILFATLASLSLPDLDGKTATVAEWRGKSPVLVVFYRGSWCRYCVEQLVQLEAAKAPGEPLASIPVLAVSPDAAARTKSFVASLARDRGVALTHRFLVDRKLVFGDRYSARPPSKGAPAPPKVVLLDRDGTEVLTYSESHYEVRPLRPLLVEAVAKLAPAPTP